MRTSKTGALSDLLCFLLIYFSLYFIYLSLSGLFVKCPRDKKINLCLVCLDPLFPQKFCKHKHKQFYPKSQHWLMRSLLKSCSAATFAYIYKLTDVAFTSGSFCFALLSSFTASQLNSKHGVAGGYHHCPWGVLTGVFV